MSRIDICWANNMIVEITGCSGAGKTTFVRQLVKRLSGSGVDVYHNLPNRFGSRTSTQINNVKWEMCGLFYLTRSMRKYGSLLKMVRGAVRKYAGGILNALRIYRAVIRKIGINEYLVGRCAINGIAIVDEGLVHSAHNLFVHKMTSYEDADVDMYVKRLILPDMIVHVKACNSDLKERVHMRSDAPRRSGDSEEKAEFIGNAIKLYDYLFDETLLKSRAIEIRSADMETELDRISDIIIRKEDGYAKNCRSTI